MSVLRARRSSLLDAPAEGGLLPALCARSELLHARPAAVDTEKRQPPGEIFGIGPAAATAGEVADVLAALPGGTAAGRAAALGTGPRLRPGLGVAADAVEATAPVAA